VTDDREIVIVRRRGARDVALVSADELTSLMETAHLLPSPRNAERLSGRSALVASNGSPHYSGAQAGLSGRGGSH